MATIDLKKLALEFDFTDLNCYYADLRVEEDNSSEIGFRNGKLQEYAPMKTTGAFLRVYNNGQWLYKFTTDLKNLKPQFQDLVKQSESFKGTCNDLFKAVPQKHDEKILYPNGNPYEGTLEKQKAICESFLGLQSEFPLIKEQRVYLATRFSRKFFKSSRGRSFSFDFADLGLFVMYNLKENESMFRDSYRKWGRSLAELENLLPEARKSINESLRHLHAPTITPGKYPVVMNSEVVGVFTHESFGHKSEADAMIGDPDALKEWSIGTKVASDTVSIVDYGAEANSSGYCPYDDDGIETKKTYLIKDGKLAGRLHSLETAFEFNEEPTGNSRAMDFQYEPIVRMTNTYIEPGKDTPEQIISGVKNGIYVSDYRHGSGLSTFTIAPTRAYWIKDGKVSDPVKVSVISGSVFQTLNDIERVGNDYELHSSVFGGCGKDEQAPLRVGDGGPTILVKEMQVG